MLKEDFIFFNLVSAVRGSHTSIRNWQYFGIHRVIPVTCNSAAVVEYFLQHVPQLTFKIHILLLFDFLLLGIL